MTNKGIKGCLVALMVASWIFAMGCSKLTAENYNKLEMGMNYDEVVAILGTADSCDGAMSAKSCLWGNDTRHIKIKFIGEKVVLFSGKGL